MLTKPDAKVLTALQSLGASGAVVEVTKFLEGEREKIREHLESTPPGENLHRLQGRAQFITEFLVLVRDAPDTLKKLKDNP